MSYCLIGTCIELEPALYQDAVVVARVEAEAFPEVAIL